jgi:uncharacterized protein Veg
MFVSKVFVLYVVVFIIRVIGGSCQRKVVSYTSTDTYCRVARAVIR